MSFFFIPVVRVREFGFGSGGKMSFGFKLRFASAFFVLIALGSPSAAEENASNPLAAVNSTDLRYQFLDLGNSADKQDAFIDGAYMLTPNLKLKYELHYNSTDVTGSRETDFERVDLTAIYFPSERKISETWGMKTAVGLEWVIDFGDTDKGIGTESDQLAPLAGLAFSNLKTGLTLIPLIQHFESYSGDVDISQTAMRLIAIQPFGEGWWAKADVKVPYDWENSTWPVTAELQVGKNINEKIALYGDLLIGMGG